MLIQNLLGTQNSINKEVFNFQTISALYNKFALLLTSTASIKSAYLNSIYLPLPLIGFEIQYTSDIPFITNEYAEYPYLNKQLLIEGSIKQNADFSITLHNLITNINPWKVQNITNQFFVDGLQYYVNKGGVFALLTPWGDIQYCVLTGLYGIINESNQVGISYRMDLKKMIRVYNNKAQVLVSKLSKYVTGTII